MAERAQAFTLEAVVAALLLVGSLVFAFQAAGVTANSAATSNPHVEHQLDGTAEGALDAAAANGSLAAAVRYFNASNRSFHGAAAGHYVASRPPTRFGRLLDRTLAARGIRYNVNVSYVTASGNLTERRMVRHGTPGDNAVLAVETVTLYDDDRLLGAGGDPRPATVADAAGFYAPDAAPGSPLYNVLRVEVVVWRV